MIPDPALSTSVTAQLLDYYRRVLMTHADDPVLGGCRVCRRPQCCDWRYARSQLEQAGELRLANPGPVIGATGPQQASAPEIQADLVVEAQRAVAAHAPERWPAVVYCRNCHSIWPCPTCRWGVGLLYAAGWSAHDLRELSRRVRNGEQPWA